MVPRDKESLAQTCHTEAPIRKQFLGVNAIRLWFVN